MENFEDILDFMDADDFLGEETSRIKDPLAEEEFEDNVIDAEKEVDNTEEESEESEELDDLEGFVETEEEEQEEEDSEEVDTPYSDYFNFLKEQNFLKTSEDFEFDGSAEKFEEALMQTEQTMAKEAMESLWSRLPAEYQKALSYSLNEGGSIKDYVRQFVDDIDYSNFSIDTETNQREVLKEYYKKTTKHDDAKIDRLLSKFDKDELYDEAQDALDYLRDAVEEEKQAKLDRLAQEKADREKQVQESNQRIANLIKDTKSVPDKIKPKLSDFIFKPTKVGKESITPFASTMRNIQQNPEHFIQFASLVMNYSPDKGFDMSKFEQKGKSKATNEFRKKLEETVSVVSRSAPSSKKLSNISWEDVINQLES